MRRSGHGSARAVGFVQTSGVILLLPQIKPLREGPGRGRPPFGGRDAAGATAAASRPQPRATAPPRRPPARPRPIAPRPPRAPEPRADRVCPGARPAPPALPGDAPGAQARCGARSRSASREARLLEPCASTPTRPKRSAAVRTRQKGDGVNFCSSPRARGGGGGAAPRARTCTSFQVTALLRRGRSGATKHGRLDTPGRRPGALVPALRAGRPRARAHGSLPGDGVRPALPAGPADGVRACGASASGPPRLRPVFPTDLFSKKTRPTLIQDKESDLKKNQGALK